MQTNKLVVCITQMLKFEDTEIRCKPANAHIHDSQQAKTAALLPASHLTLALQ